MQCCARYDTTSRFRPNGYEYTSCTEKDAWWVLQHFLRQCSAANEWTDGHYLNLPVMSDAGEIVGMVDVLKLTYATLDQVR